MKKFILNILPGYAWFPIGAVLFLNFFTYLVPRSLYGSGYPFPFVDISTPLDEMLPFVPAFMSVYLLCYAQWVLGFIMVGREGKEFCYRHFTAEMIAKSICLIFFVFMPTFMVRPEISGNGFWEEITRTVYETDAANNLFPSIHCLESWYLFRVATRMKRPGKWHVIFHLVFSLLVFASVVLVKQHLVLDILGGIAAVEIGLLCSKKISFGRFFECVNQFFIRTFNKIFKTRSKT